MPIRTRFRRDPASAALRDSASVEGILLSSRLESGLAAFLAAGLFLVMPAEISFGPRWLPLVVVTVLLIPLFVLQAAIRRPGGWAPSVRHVRLLALIILAIIAVAEGASLVLLITQLPTVTQGKQLFQAAALIWAINLLVFALCYWELDGGGPAKRPRVDYPPADFLFPQHTDSRLNAGWAPAFMDYLFLSFNTSTAFSPTDTMILSRQAKAFMMVQSLIALLTVGLVVARAVNII